MSPGRFRGLIGDGTIVAVAERGMVDALESPCVGNGVACRLPRGLTSAVDSGGVDCIERDALVAGSINVVVLVFDVVSRVLGNFAARATPGPLTVAR